MTKTRHESALLGSILRRLGRRRAEIVPDEFASKKYFKHP